MIHILRRVGGVQDADTNIILCYTKPKSENPQLAPVTCKLEKASAVGCRIDGLEEKATIDFVLQRSSTAFSRYVTISPATDAILNPKGPPKSIPQRLNVHKSTPLP